MATEVLNDTIEELDLIDNLRTLHQKKKKTQGIHSYQADTEHSLGFTTQIKLPTSTGSRKKQESSRKTSISALLTMLKPLTVWITRNCGKF